MKTEARGVTTGDDNLDVLLITHLKLCKALLQVRGSLWVSRAVVQDGSRVPAMRRIHVCGQITSYNTSAFFQPLVFYEVLTNASVPKAGCRRSRINFGCIVCQ